jgi:hypothetical protein
VRDAFGVERDDLVDKGLKEVVQGVKTWRAMAPGRRFARQAARQVKTDKLNAAFNAEKPGIARVPGEEPHVNESAKWVKRARAQAVGEGPGAARVSNKPLRRIAPKAQPAGDFVSADEAAISRFAQTRDTQRTRQAMKDSFGKSLISKKVIQRDGKYVAVSEDGSRKFGTYDTPNKAKQRIHQVDYFKAQGDKRKRKEQIKGAAGAAGGAAVAHAGYLTAGYTAKHRADRVFEASRTNQDPATKWKRKEKGAWFKHMNHPPAEYAGKTAQWRESARFFREFPEELPTHKTRRILGWTHGGKVGHAVAATGMVAGGVLGYKAVHHDKGKSVSKSITFTPKYGWRLRSLDQSGLLVPAATIGGAGAAGYLAAGRKKKRKAKK